MSQSFHDAVTGQRFQELLRHEVQAHCGEVAYDRVAPTLASCKKYVGLARTGHVELALEHVARLKAEEVRSVPAPVVQGIATAFIAAAEAYCHYANGDYATAESVTEYARSRGALATGQCPSMRLHGAQMVHNQVRILRRKGGTAEALHAAVESLLDEVVDEVVGQTMEWVALADIFLVQVSTEYLCPPLSSWPQVVPSLKLQRERAGLMKARLPTWELTFGRWWDFRHAIASGTATKALVALQDLLSEEGLLTSGFPADALARYTALAAPCHTAVSS